MSGAPGIRIALLSPKGPLYRHDGGIFRKSLRVAPLTLTTLAALVPEDLNATVTLHDEGIETIPPDLDVDLVGITVITGTAPRSYHWADHYRKRGVRVVLGGPHVTLMPEEAAGHADAVVTGYAEETWPQLLRDHVAGRLRPRYDMDPAFSFDRLPEIPFARRDLLRGTRYKTTNTFEATRGCVHDCSFCVVPTAWGRRPYLKPVGHVIDDIRRTGARHLVFYDLNLIANRAYALELFEALAPLRVKWFGLATALLNDRMIDALARSGCKGLLIGFESTSRPALEAMNKTFNHTVDYDDLVDRLHRAGIAINGTFVFGGDADTEDSFAETEDFVMRAGIDLPRFSILTPFPSTPLFRQLDAEGRIATRDWSLYDGQHLVFRPRRIDPDALVRGHHGVWRRVYGRRSIVSRLFRRWDRRASILPVLLAANVGYRHYAHNLERMYTCDGGAAFA